ncbi:hypothetical protein CDAR_82301 [Caerostris darwini]|uniref:Uncharacterized protein n=1 Tax=Caerostris darwini TaxID=1538125 RepID=A0AAV4Q7S4_9ARAC|nr:hypothetical protein CDAR_82301 [Caerostris darwini]
MREPVVLPIWGARVGRVVSDRFDSAGAIGCRRDGHPKDLLLLEVGAGRELRLRDLHHEELFTVIKDLLNRMNPSAGSNIRPTSEDESNSR